MFMYPFGMYTRPTSETTQISATVDSKRLSRLAEDYDDHGNPLESAYPLDDYIVNSIVIGLIAFAIVLLAYW